MGNTPLTVSSVNSYVEGLPENCPQATTTAAEEVPKALAAYGIGSVGASPEDSAKCLRYVSSPGFWAKHHEIHPNTSRVKNWLWVHARYRFRSKRVGGNAWQVPGSSDGPR